MVRQSGNAKQVVELRHFQGNLSEAIADDIAFLLVFSDCQQLSARYAEDGLEIGIQSNQGFGCRFKLSQLSADLSFSGFPEVKSRIARSRIFQIAGSNQIRIDDGRLAAVAQCLLPELTGIARGAPAGA